MRRAPRMRGNLSPNEIQRKLMRSSIGKRSAENADERSPTYIHSFSDRKTSHFSTIAKRSGRSILV